MERRKVTFKLYPKAREAQRLTVNATTLVSRNQALERLIHGITTARVRKTAGTHTRPGAAASMWA